MAVKLFVLGLPGSGKSTVTRYITAYLQDRNWESTRINDYVILHNMFLTDTEHKGFKPVEHEGFNVLDLAIFDEALQRLEQAVNRYIFSSTKSKKLMLIEFARNDYHEAFQQFKKEFLQDAYFLYLDANLEICKRRINERISDPSSEDDFFVSEYIFNAYYKENNGQQIPQILERDYRIDKQRVKIIENNGSLQDIIAQINGFLDIIYGLEITPDL